MTFLQPFILWGLPLILLPVIIHLLNRLRHRSQPWAAMRFLVAATRSSVNRARLKQFLILALRTLAVLALILFLARPLTGGWFGWAISGAPDTIVLLLDRSASMEATPLGSADSKRTQALRTFEKAFEPFRGRSHLALIDSATRAPSQVSGSGALLDLPMTRATDTAADIPGLIQAGVNYLIENRAGTAELWLASDLQLSNWHPEDSRWKNTISQLAALPQKVRIRLLTLNDNAGENLSVRMAEVFLRNRGANPELRLVFDLERNNPNEPSRSAPVTLSMGGANSQLDLQLEGASVRRRHTMPLGGDAEGWGSVELPTDTNLRDNKAYFVFAPGQQASSLTVAPDPAQAKFLRFAASPFGGGGKALSATPGEFETTPLDSIALIVWQSALPQGANATRLEQFVREGGVCAIFPSGEGGGAFNGFSWGAVENGTFNIRRWEQNEGPLANTDEGFPLPVSANEFLRRQLLQGPGTALAAFEDGAPFLTRQTIGRGEIFFFTTLADPAWSTLWEGPTLVPAMQRMLQSGSKRLQSARMLDSGDTAGIDLSKQWVSLDSEAKDIRLHAGVYRSDPELVAVNVPAAEQNVERMEAAAAVALMQPLSVQTFGEAQARDNRVQSEVWRMFLFAMLLFLLVEGFLILPEPKKLAEGSRSVTTAPTPVEGAA